MSEILQKDQDFNLSTNVPGLSKVMVGAGWDCDQFEGKPPIDLDLSCFLLTPLDQTRVDSDFVYYNNMEGDEGAVAHKGDNRTGAGDGDDEIIFVDLGRVDYEVASIQFVISIYEGLENAQDFSMVRNAFIRIVNEGTRKEIIHFNLSEDFKGKQAVIFGSLERNGNDWSFKTNGQAVDGGLGKLAQKYGMLVAGI